MRVVKFAIAFLCLASSQDAYCAIEVYEGFDAGPTNGSISGRAGALSFGFGDGSVWDVVGLGTEQYLAGSGLSFGSGPTQLFTTGGAVQLSGRNNASQTMRPSRPLDVSIDDDIWVSWLINEQTPNPRTIFGVGVNNSPGGWDNNNQQFTVESSNFFLPNGDKSALISNGNDTAAGVPTPARQTIMFLTKIDVSANRVKQWALNSQQFDYFKATGGGLTETELDAASFGTGGQNVLQKMDQAGGASSAIESDDFLQLFAWSQFNSRGDRARFDEIRIASNPSGDVGGGLDDVTPLEYAAPLEPPFGGSVPEASSFVVWSLVVCTGLIASRTRR